MANNSKVLIIGASSYVDARLNFDSKSKFVVVGTYSANQLSKILAHLDITNKEEVQKIIKRLSIVLNLM